MDSLTAGTSTMRDVHRPLAVEVRRGSHQGRVLFIVPSVRKQPALRWGPFVIAEKQSLYNILAFMFKVVSEILENIMCHKQLLKGVLSGLIGSM